MHPELIWSTWLPLNMEVISRSVPEDPGVYQIRPVGATTAAYIGSATGSNGLHQRIGQRAHNPLRYLSGFEKRLIQIGLKLEFRFIEAGDANTALKWEAQLINDYRLKNDGKLPPGNKQIPNPWIKA